MNYFLDSKFVSFSLEKLISKNMLNWAFLFILALSYSVTTLSQANVISRAPVNSEDNEKNPLDPTEERMIFDNLWAHFWPTSNKVNQNVSSFSLSESY
mgnify:FL=1